MLCLFPDQDQGCCGSGCANPAPCNPTEKNKSVSCQSKVGSEHKAFRFFSTLALALLSPESRGEPTGKTNNRTPNPPN